VRKDTPLHDINFAHELLRRANIKEITVMQYGQKTSFSNKVMQWLMKNVRVGNL
jgi:hypothetical protein